MRNTHDVEATTTYRLNGIPYIPHYIKKCYVPPAYSVPIGISSNGLRIFAPDTSKERTAKELEAAGAVRVTEVLWTRGQSKS